MTIKVRQLAAVDCLKSKRGGYTTRAQQKFRQERRRKRKSAGLSKTTANRAVKLEATNQPISAKGKLRLETKTNRKP